MTVIPFASPSAGILRSKLEAQQKKASEWAEVAAHLGVTVAYRMRQNHSNSNSIETLKSSLEELESDLRDLYVLQATVRGHDARIDLALTYVERSLSRSRTQIVESLASVGIWPHVE